MVIFSTDASSEPDVASVAGEMADELGLSMVMDDASIATGMNGDSIFGLPLAMGAAIQELLSSTQPLPMDMPPGRSDATQVGFIFLINMSMLMHEVALHPVHHAQQPTHLHGVECLLTHPFNISTYSSLSVLH